MSKLVWDQVGERLYETGTKKGVLYPFESNAYAKGVAWNGLTAVTESPSGAEATAIYADDIKYLNLRSAEEFGATIEAYTYPDEFAECDGSAYIAPGIKIGQQKRKMFGFSYTTTVGNDTEGDDHGYKIHLVYGATASPSEKSYQTINDSPEAITFSWEFTTTPVEIGSVTVNGTTKTIKKSAILTIDTAKVLAGTEGAQRLTLLKNYLYGTDSSTSGGTNTTGTKPQLPPPATVIGILNGTVTNLPTA